MRGSGRFPAWLVRRSYFGRIARWLKPRRRVAAQGAARPEPEPAPSNVLPFPEQPGAPRGMAFPLRRGVGAG